MADDSKLSSDLVLAADLGGTHLRTAAIDQNGKIHFRSKRQTPKADKPAVIVEAIVDAVNDCRRSDALTGKTIAALSIAVPGTVSFNERRVITVPNLPCLENFDLGPVVQEAVGCPVLIENDANAAVLGEMWLGAARGYQNVICITLGTGVGGGIILNGELLRGVDGSAGEIGHIGVDPFSGVRCNCGSEGCLEVYASGTGIVRMATESLSGQALWALQAEGALTAERLFASAMNGDKFPLNVFKRMGSYLGVGIASLVNLLNPEMVVIGGGVANAWQLFEESMLHTIAERSFPAPAKRVKITRAECGDDAGLLGAARLAFVQMSDMLYSLSMTIATNQPRPK
ncbi:MAG TPA: ROK family protein [Pyrinomonadaceae bacterium]|nr:ROK family protein [Pyrinomonadaceae bacterium]